MAAIDDREIREFAADLRRAPQRVVDKVPGVIKKGMTKIKAQMVEEMGASFWFKGAKPAISFDILDGGFTGECGPVSGPGGVRGDIASIAYFGGAQGGGTVPDPKGALDAEADRTEKALGDILGGVL